MPLPHAVRASLHALGALRTVLVILVVLSIVSAPFAGGEVVLHFPEVVPTLVAPPFAVMLAFILPLDILMSSLFLSARAGAARRRLRGVIITETALLLALLAAWAPYFSRFATR